MSLKRAHQQAKRQRRKLAKVENKKRAAHRFVLKAKKLRQKRGDKNAMVK